MVNVVREIYAFLLPFVHQVAPTMCRGNRQFTMAWYPCVLARTTHVCSTWYVLDSTGDGDLVSCTVFTYLIVQVMVILSLVLYLRGIQYV